MSKKTTKEAYWFKHDQNAQDDPKIVRMKDRWGATGYGIFWYLIEKLRGETDHTLQLDMLPIYTRMWKGATTEMVESIVMDFKLFVVEEGFFWSNRLKRQMEEKEEKSQKAKKSIESRWSKIQNEPPGNDTNVIRTYNERNTNVSRENTNPTPGNDTNVIRTYNERITNVIRPLYENDTNVSKENANPPENDTKMIRTYNERNTNVIQEEVSNDDVDGNSIISKLQSSNTNPNLSSSLVESTIQKEGAKKNGSVVPPKKEEEKKEPPSSSPTAACAANMHAEYRKQFLQDKKFLDELMLTTGIKRLHIDQWLNLFHLNLSAESDKQKPNYAEYKRHFRNWVFKQDYKNVPRGYVDPQKNNPTMEDMLREFDEE